MTPVVVAAVGFLLIIVTLFDKTFSLSHLSCLSFFWQCLLFKREVVGIVVFGGSCFWVLVVVDGGVGGRILDIFVDRGHSLGTCLHRHILISQQCSLHSGHSIDSSSH